MSLAEDMRKLGAHKPEPKLVRMSPSTFLLQSERAARMMQPHVDALAAQGTIYDRGYALFSIMEQARAACSIIDDSQFWHLLAMHLAGDRTGFDEMLNKILDVK